MLWAYSKVKDFSDTHLSFITFKPYTKDCESNMHRANILLHLPDLYLWSAVLKYVSIINHVDKKNVLQLYKTDD